MKRIFYLLALFLPLFSWAELPFLKNVAKFEIATPQDTIRFIRIAQDTTVCKPVLLFLQGSLPYPLIVTDSGKASIFYLDQCDFDYESVSRDYHIILIAKPHTPVIADVTQLNDHWQYVPDLSTPDRFDPAYRIDDRLEKYTERADTVLAFIRQQPWADSRKIIVMGHSQGAHAAARVASHNSDLYAVGYFSGNPMGRFAEMIIREENAAKSGRISRSEAQANIEQLYAQWKSICRNKNKNTNADLPATWMSFSSSYIDLLTALPMPLYIAYGTEDPAGQNCALLPVYFELAGKQNYRIRAFENRGHNFEAIRSDGSSDYDDIQWKQAVGEFLAWCQKPE